MQITDTNKDAVCLEIVKTILDSRPSEIRISASLSVGDGSFSTATTSAGDDGDDGDEADSETPTHSTRSLSGSSATSSSLKR